MYCPKCATQNSDGAKFCRSCGADISLVPNALTGQMPEPGANDIGEDRHSRRKHKREKPPSPDRGIKGFFMGLGFLFVSLALSTRPEGRGWWYWMLIPAFSMIGGGVAEFVRAQIARKELSNRSDQTQTSISGAQQVNALPPRSTSELVAQPPSVTEGTTRHLGSEGPTKVFVPAERSKER